MKCPLRHTQTQYPEERVGIDTWDCLEDKCAWWHKAMERCILLTIEGDLWSISHALGDIADKMPYKPRI